MKFAKELDHELVPEWRAKYLDYKAGKKKVKAISRAIQKTARNPTGPSLQQISSDRADRPSARHPPASDSRIDTADAGRTGSHTTPVPQSAPIQRNERHERQPLRTPGSRFSSIAGSYGSIIATPPDHHNAGSDVASIKLPDPAIDPTTNGAPDSPSAEENHGHQNGPKVPSPVLARRDGFVNTPAHLATSSPPDRKPSVTSGKSKGSTFSGPSARKTSQFLKRVFSNTDQESRDKSRPGELRSEVGQRQEEFLSFLDQELHKIESFYQMKETEARQRLETLRQQLHIMRDSRIQQVLESKNQKGHKVNGGHHPHDFGLNGTRLKNGVNLRNRFGKNSEALTQLASPGNQTRDRAAVAGRRDFTRRPELQTSEVPYRTAKRKLKYALQEFYRGLELLKAYAYLNRTAFRKINKKYDKVVHARASMRYMTENVNKAWFVQSEVIENLMTEVEDLYARYFERGNRKIAISKLRRTGKKSGDYSPNTFRTGLLLMAGLLFGIQSLVYAGQHFRHDDATIRLRTGYLLQLYGGFFLIVFHFLLFCLDCMIWTKSRINYVFVFEYDTRNALDWRQLTELPSLFFFLLGLFMWLNFMTINAMYLYWPVVLIGLTVIIMFLPFQVLYHRSRKWWAFSNWRLLLAGIYPVEFRDFFLGDMYCSQTYSMGNIELFFCLYARHWTGLAQCNSNSSRLFGFFQCVPAIFRAFQCLRRFADTRNIFPHLVNFGKYTFTVLYYATLSLYRIDQDKRFQAVFITFALLNAIYCSVWDLAMDFSLCNPYAKHPFLREVLAFHRPWVYYLSMVVDVIIRFNWILYAIFTHDLGHAKVMSFVVSFSEVCRRGMWSIFRVENEHCTNVVLFRASRDVPLPYELPRTDETPRQQGQSTESVQLQDRSPTTPPDVEQGGRPTSGPRPRRPPRVAGISRVGTILASAHAQDFERRKLPEQMHESAITNGPGHSPEDTSEEEYEEDSNDHLPKDDDAVEELPFVNSQARNDDETGPPSLRS